MSIKESDSDPFETSMGLILRTREKDPESERRFVQIYFPLVMSWCRKGGLRFQDSQDISQDALSTAVRKLKHFRKDKPEHKFRAWLNKIVRHAAIDFAEKQEKQFKATGGSGSFFNQIAFESAASETGSNNELIFNRALELVRANFKKKHYEAFVRVAINGMDPEQVARELGISRNVVYQAKSRILKQLKTDLRGFIDA
jgi:RNA polymerase sigma-70 factor (ECF subfamily)